MAGYSVVQYGCTLRIENEFLSKGPACYCSFFKSSLVYLLGDMSLVLLAQWANPALWRADSLGSNLVSHTCKGEVVSLSIFSTFIFI